MIALTIGLFLVGGLLTLVFAMRRTSTSQSGLSQLQDNERMGMSIITDSVQSAGYYPNPLANAASTFFPAAGAFAAGQSMTGTHVSATTADTIAVRYATAGNDNTINCAGGTSATQKSWTNTFHLDTATKTILQCDLFDSVANTTTTVNLVSGVINMQVQYGVRTNPASVTNSADTYLTANQITNWANVFSVKVTLTYANPLAGQPGQTSTTIAFTRVITVMNTTGVDT